MRTLINASFKALRTGTYVSASEEALEFIFDSINTEEITIATLLEIGTANGTTIKRGTKAEVTAALVAHLITLELPTMNEVPDSVKVAEIVAAGVKESKSDEDMVCEILQAGIKLRVAAKLFAVAMLEGGYRVTNKQRKIDGRAMLVDVEFSPASYDEYTAMIEKMVKELSDTVTSQAHSIIRTYAKEFDLEMPKPPKKVSGGIRGKIAAFLLGDPSKTVAELLAHLVEGGHDAEKAQKIVNGNTWVVELVNKLNEANAQVAETAEAA